MNMTANYGKKVFITSPSLWVEFVSEDLNSKVLFFSRGYRLARSTTRLIDTDNSKNGVAGNISEHWPGVD